MSKTLVTHINPHLDDIAAIWLFERFNPDFKDSNIEFMSASRNEGMEDSDDRVYLGVGRGQFDEHKGDLEDCAASLVYKYLKEKGLIPQREESKALEELVEWVRLDDLGKLPAKEYPEFAVPSWIRSQDSTQEGSLKTTKLGEEILDRIFEVLKRKYSSEKEWQGRVEFESRFGKSFAVKGELIDRAFCKRKGGDLFIMYTPSNHWVQYFTPSFEIDLEPIYKRVKELDPQADWFLHQSHHMVICGSGSAPDTEVTKLSFEELIEVAKSV